MNTLQDLRRHLQDSFDAISAVWQYGDWFEGLDAIGLAEEACRLACRFGCDVPMTAAKTPQEALRIVGRLLAWAGQEARSPVLDVHDVARLLGCTERTIWRHEGKRLIPEARRVGGIVRWDRAEIEEWLANKNTRE
jgi:predicted DNA-binding transcriptional regulator AlpA